MSMVFTFLLFYVKFQVFSGISGLIDLSKELNGVTWKLEPFPPSHFEEYKIQDDGKATLVGSTQYYKIGDKPLFRPLVPYECKCTLHRHMQYHIAIASHFWNTGHEINNNNF